MTKTSQLINAEWNDMSDEAKVTAAATARAEQERDQGNAVEQELATPGKRAKYVKGYADKLMSAVRVLISARPFVLTGHTGCLSKGAFRY
jgi:hypothetical protein